MVSEVTTIESDLGGLEPPMQPARALAWAVVGSLVLHVVLLFGVPQLDFSWLRTNASGLPPIEARIVTAPPVPPTAALAPRGVPKPKSKPRPKPRPKPPAGAAPAMTIEAPEPPPAVNEQLRERFAGAEHLVEGDIAPMEPEAPLVADATPAGDPPSPATGDASPAPQPIDPPPASANVPPVPAADQAPDAASPTVAPPLATPPLAAPPAPERAPAKYPLKRARLVYDLAYGFGGAVAGQVIHTLVIDGGNYRVETIAEPTGLLSVFYGGKYVQRSRGHLGPDGFVPEEYFVMRGKESRIETAAFDWAAKRITFRWGTETRTADLRAGVQDTVSMLHQFYFMQPLAASSKLRLATARKLYDSAYQVIGEETIETPLGSIATLRVRRREDDADRIDLWIDPKRDFLPMRIYYEDRKKNILEQTIREFSAEAAD